MYDDLNQNMGFARLKREVSSALADVKRRSEAPSNRCNICPTNVYPVPTLLGNGSVGVDRVKIGIPFDPDKSDWKAFLSHLKRSPIGEHGRAVKVGDRKTGARFEFFVWPGATASVVYVEFNPSRYRDPTGYSLLHPDEVKNVIREVIETYFTSDLLIPTFMVNLDGTIDRENWDVYWKSAITLCRLVASADFLITDSEFSAELLSGIKAKRAHGTHIAYNNKMANSWSNILKSGDGRMIFYNKAAQTLNAKIAVPAPTGTYRFEYRMEQRHLSYNHLHTLADLSEDRFEAALRSGWNLSHLSSPITKDGAWKEFIRHSALAHNQKAELIGFLEEDLREDSIFPDFYRKTMRAKAKRLGLTFRKNLCDQSPWPLLLDLDARDLIKQTPKTVSALPYP